jgi:hypothetical protein
VLCCATVRAGQRPIKHASIPAPACRHAAAQSEVGQFGHLKKVIRYLFASHPQLMEEYRQLVRVLPKDMSSGELLDGMCQLVHRHWPASGPSQHVLINHMARA